MKLYAFQPNNWGPYSFFVMADSKDEAIKAIFKHIEDNKIYEDCYDGILSDEYYEVKVLEKGEVVINNNEF